MIDEICHDYNYYKPRMYCENARRDYLILAKCKKRTAKKIRKAVKQQLQYMYENNTHTVPDCIVSISQPYIRPIVRGKAAVPVEFGTRLEKLSFDAYNESDVLISAIKRYRERTGHYSGRGLDDQRKMPQPIKKRNTLTMLTAWKSKNPSVLPRDAMGLAGFSAV